MPLEYLQAELQAQLIVAEQSLEYGDITMKQICNDIAAMEKRLNSQEKECIEAEIVALKEERNTMMEEIEQAHTTIKTIRSQLNKYGCGPYSGEITKEMKTLGARLSLIHRLSELPGFSAQAGFTQKTIEIHFSKSAEYKARSEECKKLGNTGQYVSCLAAHHFYDIAHSMLKTCTK